MGFPIIMYLSRGKVEGVLKKKLKPIISGIKPKISFSLNPEVSIDAELKMKDNLSDVRGNNDWPPKESLDIVTRFEKQLKKNNQIGTMEDFVNKNLKYTCYKLKGKLVLNESEKIKLFGNIIGHGISGILILEGTKKKVLVYLSYESVAGMLYNDGKWEAWESGAIQFLNHAVSKGYDLIGLFTYEGESDKYFADCGIVYFANMQGKNFYCDKKIKGTIYDEYI